MAEDIRLTSLAHGGGCGCKLSPSVLRDILATMPAAGAFANLMVGTETSDDAAVWKLNDSQALVATTDFFMPVVDDPFEFGRIAATNALSDIYAMGATPILALAIVGMPVGVMPVEMIRKILEGGAVSLRGGRRADCGGAFDRQQGADLWACGAGTGASGQAADQPHGQGWRRADPHQAAGCRHLQRGAEAGPAGCGWVCRHDRIHHEAEYVRQGSRRDCGRSRPDRRNRIWPARSHAGDGARRRTDGRDRRGASAAARRCGVGARGRADGGLHAQLGQLWRCGCVARGIRKLAVAISSPTRRPAAAC